MLNEALAGPLQDTTTAILHPGMELWKSGWKHRTIRGECVRLFNWLLIVHEIIICSEVQEPTTSLVSWHFEYQFFVKPNSSPFPKSVISKFLKSRSTHYISHNHRNHVPYLDVLARLLHLLVPSDEFGRELTTRRTPHRREVEQRHLQRELGTVGDEYRLK